MLNQKLTQPGWAGDLTKEELAFIKDAPRETDAFGPSGGLAGEPGDSMMKK